MKSFKIFAERPMEISHKYDLGLIISLILLWGIGFLTLYTCSANRGLRIEGDALFYTKNQLIVAGLGFACCFVLSIIRLADIKKILKVLVFGTLILCGLTFIPALSTSEETYRWFRIPGINIGFQPSELVKFTVILFLANWFDKYMKVDEEERPSMVKPFCVLGLFVSIVMIQEDFSTALFIFCVGILMFYVAVVKLGKMIPFIILAAFAMLLFVLCSEFRVQRLIAFLNPNYDTLGSNYQTSAARDAISAGGFLGDGFGVGLDKINRVPEIHTDYIFSGWVEAMGLLGVIAYFLILGFFSWRGFVVSLRCSNRFGCLTGFGITISILIQSLLNTGVVCGALPSTGIPLPFFSYGRSSLFIFLCMCGLLINISRYNENEENTDENIVDF